MNGDCPIAADTLDLREIAAGTTDADAHAVDLARMALVMRELYARLDWLQREIAEAHAQADALRAGAALREARAMIRRSQWARWLRSTGCTSANAQRYMLMVARAAWRRA